MKKKPAAFAFRLNKWLRIVELILYPATSIDDGARTASSPVDRGDIDICCLRQLPLKLLRATWAMAGINPTFRLQPGYDNSYDLISILMADHRAWHSERLL